MFTVWCDGKDGVDLEVLITVRGGPNPGFDGVFVRNFVSVFDLTSEPALTLRMTIVRLPSLECATRSHAKPVPRASIHVRRRCDPSGFPSVLRQARKLCRWTCSGQIFSGLRDRTRHLPEDATE